jgi:AraC-like DNA-binding protein
MPAPPFEPDRPYIVSSYLRGLLGYLRSRAVPLQPVLDVIGLSEEELGDPDRRIDHSRQREIFRVAEQLTGDANVGLHAGEATQLMHFGIIGLLTLTCKTVRELVELHSRFQGLITNGATVRYVALGDELVGEVSSAEGPASRHTVEYNTTSHLTVARLMVGFDFSPARIEVTYEEPADTSEQQRVFGCPVRYGCERQRVCFPSSLLDFPLVVADSGSRGVLEVEARKRLDMLSSPSREEKTGLAALRHLVGRGLLGGPPSLEQAAATLGVSVRTLQRRLEAQRMTYRDVVDVARKEMADRYMRADDLSQVDVALLIGFSDQSAFYRAFRRWFGKTPGEYRAQLRPR